MCFLLLHLLICDAPPPNEASVANLEIEMLIQWDGEGHGH